MPEDRIFHIHCCENLKFYIGIDILAAEEQKLK
jgi:hypothetical protein